MTIESISEVRAAVERAEREIARADSCVKDMAYLIRGRMRKAGIPDWVLRELKSELASYNMHTGKWRD